MGSLREGRQERVVLRSVVQQSIREVVRECMERMEWRDVVPAGATVVIKPNLCTADPEKVEGSNTNPEITAAICELLLSRTRRVYMGESDGLRHKAEEAFAASGYESLAHKLGVELVNFSKAPWVRTKCVPAGEIYLPKILLDCDVLITLPVLKTHALTYFTGALKNQWGCLPQYDRILLHKHLDPLLATLHGLLRPQLALMDAIVAMEGRGPANGKPRRLDLLLASRDAVALDATAMRLVGLEPTRARHLVLAAEKGLGRVQPGDIMIDGDWDRHRAQFEPAIRDKAIATMDYLSRYRWFVKYFLEQDFLFYPARALVNMLRRVGMVEGG